jgi:DNA-binding FrmR family transcriptional regulator
MHGQQIFRDLFPSDIYLPGYSIDCVGHTLKHKQKLIARMKRIRGQMEAVERALDQETDCSEVLQLIAAARGGMNGLMAELMEGHLRDHVLEPVDGEDPHEAADELMDVIRRYLK